MRALITGIGGFVGGHLATLLKKEGIEVFGVDRVAVDPGSPAAKAATEIAIGDICDPAFTSRVVQDAQPTHVFQLAWGFENAGAGNEDGRDGNLISTRVLLEAVRASSCRPTVLNASSSAVYGAATQLPIDEGAPLKPTTPYGASKLAVEAFANDFAKVNGMCVISARTFNLLGPGMPERLFAGSLAAQLATAERGGSNIVKTGRLDPRRDYVDVRDAARAYLALAQIVGGPPGCLNVCAGVSHSCRELADIMIAAARVPVTLLHDESRLQSRDVDEQVGSSARLRQATGWSPEIPFADSVRDTLDYERRSDVR